jgi:hypothetical protein
MELRAKNAQLAIHGKLWRNSHLIPPMARHKEVVIAGVKNATESKPR